MNTPLDSGMTPEPKPKRDKPTRVLPTERVQFAKQLNLLRAYAVVSGTGNKEVRVADVAEVAKMSSSSISLCNGFLVDVGLIERIPTGGFLPAEETRAFQRAYQWNPDVAPHKLAPKLRNTWFWELLRPKLMMGAVQESMAIQDLADRSSAGKRNEPQLELLIEYLEAAGMVVREGGMLRESATARATDNTSPDIHPSATKPVVADAALNVAAQIPDPSPPLRRASPAGQGVNFSIDVNVDMIEIGTWSADRITAFFSGIASVLAAKSGVDP